MPSHDALPKRIWFYWHQGQDSAPDLVKKCYQSWHIRNPDWELVELNSTNLSQYLDESELNCSRLKMQASSDLIRINLLRKHGGIWVDASCFCMRPLDEWLNGYMTEGFFAFSNPGKDRLLSSWFLASDQQHYLASQWADAANRYWTGLRSPSILAKPQRAAKLVPPKIWFSRPVKDWLRVYPYYWFHHLFRHLYENDHMFKKAWDKVPKLGADAPHAALRQGLHNPIAASFRQEVDRRESPLYKLNWRMDPGESRRDSVLQYLYQTL